MINADAAAMYKPQYAAAEDIAISCDCATCKAEALTAAYWVAIDETLVAYQSGRLDAAGFGHARFVIHSNYREAMYMLESN